jgi:CRP/FNR family transcriptional regulator, cyclic AMP receptor protein
MDYFGNPEWSILLSPGNKSRLSGCLFQAKSPSPCKLYVSAALMHHQPVPFDRELEAGLHLRRTMSVAARAPPIGGGEARKGKLHHRCAHGWPDIRFDAKSRTAEAITAKVEAPLRGTELEMAKNTPQSAFDPKAFLAIVGDGKTILEIRKDQIVFAQGDVADTVFYIQKGRVKVVVASEQGKEAVVGIFGPDQFFGEGCMNGHSVRIATTTAMEDCLITAITKTAMLATLQSQSKFSEMFMAYLLTRNSRIEEDLIDQLFNSSEKRLARLLLLLANFGKEGSPQPIVPNISQETLAEMIGTTRSRVSFFMNKFRKLGFISYNGKIEVNSSLLNAILYDKPEIKRDP